MADSGESSEDQNVDRNMVSKDRACEVSDGNKDAVGNWTQDHLCYILAKNVSTYFPHPKMLCEAESQLTDLVEEISRLHDI